MNAIREDVAALPSVLKKLGVMTALRDSYLVEQSLLRTLGPVLGVLETALYRVDDRSRVARAVYHSREVLTREGSQSVSEKIVEVDNELQVEKPIEEIIANVRLLGKGSSRQVGNEYIICYPIYGRNEQLGYFVFRRDHEVSPVEEAVIIGILEVFTNYFDLLDISQRDQLTGLLNRHSLESSLDRIWSILSARMHSGGKSGIKRLMPDAYWLCVVDIDHFKSINDTYGHIIGDEVLVLASRLLQQSLRQSDLLYRFGGEEFIAIAAASSLEAATQIFERARKRVEQYKFPQVGFITISGGFCKADPGVLPQEVLSRADRSLYIAKETGRNRICFYDDLVEQGVLKDVPTGSVDLF